jgi:hypothetical protein
LVREELLLVGNKAQMGQTPLHFQLHQQAGAGVVEGLLFLVEATI